MRRRARRLARLGVEVRNELIFDDDRRQRARRPTNYRLEVRMSSTSLQVIVDINTARPDIQNYGIDANYTLTDVATGKRGRHRHDLRARVLQHPRPAAALRRRPRPARRREPRRQGDRRQYPQPLASYFVAGT